MNNEVKTFLSHLAGSVKLKIDFPMGEPIRISGFQDTDEPFYLISIDQPESDLIFSILQKISLVPAQGDDFWSGHFPWFLNRAYENEKIGVAVHKIRRVLRQQFTRKQRANYWALSVYSQMPCVGSR